MTHIDLGKMKQELDEEARSIGLSLSAYIRMLLSKSPDRIKVKK